MAPDSPVPPCRVRASTASSLRRMRPFWRSRWTSATSSSAETTPFRSARTCHAVPSNHSVETVEASSAAGPSHTSGAAIAASRAFRTSVFAPIGSDRTWPKHWHCGLRPRNRLTPIARVKTARSASTPSAPHQAEPAGTKATAQTSSAIGRSTAPVGASAAGTPNAMRDRAVPARSATLATPARAKTAARPQRAISITADMSPPSYEASAR